MNVKSPEAHRRWILLKLDWINIMRWLQVYGDRGVEYGGLNETSPWAHIFEYLVGGIIWEKLEAMALLER